MLFGDAPDNVSVGFSDNIFSSWLPSPGINAVDEVRWRDEGLVTGMRLGFGLFTADESVWAVRGRIFSVDDDGAIVFQSGSGCSEQSPDFNRSVDDLDAALAACAADADANAALDDAVPIVALAQCAIELEP